MKRMVWLWELFGFAVTSLCGTLLHFLYDLSGESPWAAPFSGVNESTWEHMKLLFWPMLVYTALQFFFFRDHEGFPCTKLRGILLGLSLIPLIFYTYNGVIDKSPDWVNIAIFFLSAAVAYVYEARALKRGAPCKHPPIALAGLCLLALLFTVFTFFPPEIGVFRDPLTGGYGIQGACAPIPG